MRKKQNKNFTLKDVEGLLSQQTVTIFERVDGRFEKVDKRFEELNERFKKARQETERMFSEQAIVILDAVDKKLEKTTKEFKQEINKLRISIDKFVGFYTKQDQEFTIMKEHLKRLEARVVNLEAKLT